MSSLLQQSESSAEAISAAIKADARNKVIYTTIGSSLVKLRSENMPNLSSQEIVHLLHQYSDGVPGLPPHIYRLAEEMRRWALDHQSSQLILLRGKSGSGKSESFRSFLQHIFFTDVAMGAVNFPPSRNCSFPLGTVHNQFMVSSEASSTVKKLYASICCLTVLGSAPTAANGWSSRVSQYLQLNFSSQGRLLNAQLIPLFTETLRCNPRDLNVGPPMIQHLLVHSKHQSDGLMLTSQLKELYTHSKEVHGDEELDHLHEVLVTWGGLSQSHWESMLRVVAAIIHLQNLTILGTESAMVSANTKGSLASAESLLGLVVGSLSGCILKKTDERPSRPAGSMMDCRPFETRALVDILCTELMTRMMNSTLDALRANHSVDIARFFDHQVTQNGSVHLLDPSGWERLIPTQPGHFLQLMNMYTEEKLSGFSVEYQLMGELQRYVDEGIQVDFVEVPSLTAHLELIELVPGGLMNILDEIGATQKPDDKSFADRAILSYGRAKLIKAGGAKTKSTTFVVKHSFSDAAYDCDGFIFNNKHGEFPTAINSALRPSTISFVSSAIAYGGLAPPIAIPSEEKRGKSKALQVWPKYQVMIDRLLSFLSACEKKNFVLCVNATTATTAAEDQLIAQAQHLLLPNLLQLSRFGYGYIKNYRDFFNRFRFLVRFDHDSIPLHLPDDDDDEEEEEVEVDILKSYCSMLLQDLLPVVHPLGVIYDTAGDNLALHGNYSIFLQENFAEPLERARFAHYERNTSAALRIQCHHRMRKSRNRFLSLKLGLITFQAFVRRRKCMQVFQSQRKAATKVKSWYITCLAVNRLQRMKAAVNIIKSRFLGKMVQHLRYQRLIRAARRLHHMVRGSLQRRSAGHVYDAVLLLQRTFRSLVNRRRLLKRRLKATAMIQRLFRGYRSRARHSKLVEVLKVRRNQRVAAVVVRKIQSLWRGKLVVARFQEVVQATVRLQRVMMTHVQRRRFLITRALAIWLQSHARRMSAAKKANAIKVTNMVRAEKGSLSSLYLQEIKALLLLQQQQQQQQSLSSSPAIVTSGFTNHGRDRFDRLLIAYDFCFDLSIAYPDGWLPVLLRFSQQLRVDHNRSILLVAAGAQHTLLVDDNYNVYSFGLGDLGQLGLNNRKSFSTPRKIESLQRLINLGDGKTSTASLASQPVVSQRIGILSVCCGQDHSLLLTSTRKVFSFGDNRRGQLGHSLFESCAMPRLVTCRGKAVFTNIRSISCGKYHSACVAEPGIVYVWGSGESVSGVGSRVDDSCARFDSHRHVLDVCEPVMVAAFPKKRVIDMVCGEVHVAVLSLDGVFAWGGNSYGQLGLGHTNDVFQVSMVAGLTLSSGSQVERDWQQAELRCGGRHMLLRCRGKVWAWGWNKYGAIGDGSLENALRPVRINVRSMDDTGNNLSSGRNSPVKGAASSPVNNKWPLDLVVGLATGWRSSFVLTKSGKLYGWGVINPLTLSTASVAATEQQDGSAPIMTTDDPFAMYLTPQLLPFPSNGSGKEITGMLQTANGLGTLSLFMVDRLVPRDEALHETADQRPFTATLAATDRKSAATALTRSLSSAAAVEPSNESKATANNDPSKLKSTIDANKKKSMTAMIREGITKAKQTASEKESARPKNATDEVMQRFRSEVGRLSLYPSSTTSNRRLQQNQTAQNNELSSLQPASSLSGSAMSNNNSSFRRASSATINNKGMKNGGLCPVPPLTQTSNSNNGKAAVLIAKPETDAMLDLFSPSHLRSVKANREESSGHRVSHHAAHHNKSSSLQLQMGNAFNSPNSKTGVASMPSSSLPQQQLFLQSFLDKSTSSPVKGSTGRQLQPQIDDRSAGVLVSSNNRIQQQSSSSPFSRSKGSGSSRRSLILSDLASPSPATASNKEKGAIMSATSVLQVSSSGESTSFRRQMMELGYLKRQDKPRPLTPQGFGTK